MVGHKNENARRYLRYLCHQSARTTMFRSKVFAKLMFYLSLSKATTLERTYGPAWIAYGHSFAMESEHDQAMAAYFTAAQLMKGYSHNSKYNYLCICNISAPNSRWCDEGGCSHICYD